MQKEKFYIGANYWASHAGIRMWENWDEKAVDDDFKRLSEFGIEQIRMFPLWSAFQPIEQLCRWQQQPQEIYIDELPLPDTEAGFCGVDEVMIERFERALRLAEKHGLKVAVGILTGWMSGRMFAPEALRGRNLTSDPVALRWELAFVKYFVKRFKDDPAIIAWSAGNETDCLADSDKESRWVWSQMMANTIRSVDSTRPITEDMHPLRENGSTELRARKNIHDITTVHPYTGFTPYAGNESAYSMRGMLFYTAEAKAYADITGLPCLIEEIGNLGNSGIGKEQTANVMNTVMWTALAEGNVGFIWWCAHDQSRLGYAPYDWCAVERELGMFDSEFNAKPIGLAMRQFAKDRNALPFEDLAPPLTDAVCVLQGTDKDWGIILGSYVLSKQAGVNIKFAHSESIPSSEVYFLPCIAEGLPYNHVWKELLSRVEKGATLYISYSTQYVTNLRDITGNEPIYHHFSDKPRIADGLAFEITDKLNFMSCESTVLMADQNGDPLFTVHNYGKGKVFFLAAPLELNFSESKDGFDPRFSDIYKTVTEGKLCHGVEKNAYCLGKVERETEDGRYIFITNYSPEKVSDNLTFADGYRLKEVVRGSVSVDGKLEIDPFGTAIFKVLK